MFNRCLKLLFPPRLVSAHYAAAVAVEDRVAEFEGTLGAFELNMAGEDPGMRILLHSASRFPEQRHTAPLTDACIVRNQP